MKLPFEDLRRTPNMINEFEPLHTKMLSLFDLNNEYEETKPVQLSTSSLMRICLIAGLSQNDIRKAEEVNNAEYYASTSYRIYPTVFSYNSFASLFESLVKLRYHDTGLNLDDSVVLSKLVCVEIVRGRDYLMTDNNLESYLYTSTSRNKRSGLIPEL